MLVRLAFSAASYQRAQVFESSETFWGDVLSTYPGTPLALNSLGRHLLDEADDVDRAQALFEEALRERPDYALPHYNLGVVYERRGDEALARESYEKALELAPRDVTNRISVARFHSRVGDTRRAIEHYEVAVEHDPESLVAWYNLGLMHAKLSRFEAAKRALRRATLVAPDFGGSYASLGAIARVERRPKDALALYEQAKAAGHPVSRQILEGLRAELDVEPGAAP